MESVEVAASGVIETHNLEDSVGGWDSVNSALRGSVGEDAFQRWFGAAVWKGVNDGVATLAVPGEIHQVWIETNYLPELQAAVLEAFPDAREVGVVVNDAKAQAAELDRIASRQRTDPLLAFADDADAGFGDIGGFDVSSELTWQAMAGFGYRVMDNGAILLGYRGIGTDYTDGGFTYDVVAHGPVIGFEYHF
jgi:opacity protein-like surface antigen